MLLTEEANSNNQTSIWLSSFSLGITFLLGVVTLINSLLISRSDRKQQGYREVIAKQRLQEYNDIRQYLVMFLQTVDIYLKNNLLDSSGFDSAYLNLMCQFKPQYKEDAEILHQLSQFKNLINKCEKSNISPEVEIKIRTACDNIKNMIFAYCAANWKCIKEELGKTEMKYNNSSEYYKEILSKIESKSESNGTESENNKSTVE